MKAIVTAAALLALGGTTLPLAPTCLASAPEATVRNATLVVADDQTPDNRFRQVDGVDLKSRLAAAIALGRKEAAGKKFYAAYGFDVRPGVAVDVELRVKDGDTIRISSMNVAVGDDVKETRNLGVFLQYGATGDEPERLEVLNLERAHNFEVIPVFWMGRAETKQSLDLLEDLVRTRPDDLAERATFAVAIHNDPAVVDALERIVRSNSAERARKSALLWIGQFSDRIGLLESVARDERESRGVREHAILAIGASKNPNAIATLKNLYTSLTDHRVREHVFVAVIAHDEEGRSAESDEFLIDAARNERDREMRKQAIFWLSQRAGKRTMGAIEESVESPDDEIQKQAVFAISQRPKEEALPILMRLAREHRSPTVRKQAVFWLGQYDDDRVVEFLRDLILNTPGK